MNKPNTIPESVRDGFIVWGAHTLYPVTITTDVKTQAGNVLLAEGERTWGMLNPSGLSVGVTVWSPSHYAGCEFSSIIYGYEVDYDGGIEVGR